MIPAKSSALAESASPLRWMMPTIKHVRAFTVRDGGADCRDQKGGHWIDSEIATPMSRYPEYRQTRSSFGLNVLDTLVIEVDDGTIGFAVTTAKRLGIYRPRQSN
jgi:L-rhamnonate dehydratase